MSSGSTWPRLHIFLKGAKWFDAVLGRTGLMLSVCYRLWLGAAQRTGQTPQNTCFAAKGLWCASDPPKPALTLALGDQHAIQEASFFHLSCISYLAVRATEKGKNRLTSRAGCGWQSARALSVQPQGEAKKKEQFGLHATSFAHEFGLIC